MVLLASDPRDRDRATPEERQGFLGAHDAFEREVAARGSKVSGAPLASADTATTLRHDDGRLTVTDGPFAELVEQVAFTMLLASPGVDLAHREALAESPSATGRHQAQAGQHRRLCDGGPLLGVEICLLGHEMPFSGCPAFGCTQFPRASRVAALTVLTT